MTSLIDCPAAGEQDETLATAVPDRDIASAMRVLRMEANALTALAASLDGAFTRALDTLAGIAGRVVVTGMGKSGHVARKIAATLASTGTPALFVHPGEASHGDLGMIAREDAVIALSNSGETHELSDVIAYTRRFAIPLIGITRRAGSSLAEQSDVALVLPSAPEACPLGLAPTTSTTMMLALGDALAVALLERRGFTASDFKELHPGGQLGRALLKVTDVMHKGDDMPLCGLDTPLSDVILEMTAKRLGCVGVLDDAGVLVGVITDGDLRRHLKPELLAERADSILSPRPKTIRPKALVVEALREMNEKQITSLFVIEADRPLGVVHIHDCLRAGAA
ncbi:arabinose-5-phosphate isomerase [Azospirillum rugosum]|uniref:Arabinose-5-phosphate isomerase n=2 Tax=Azospirillum rugosum TaxID=416170 RepID=A0ABS4SH04_9PROT|nr:arabinose-5-phosphate isomerase [Azospirillum rugosum]MDQ0524342.1 arabinose-5-phosphate isomerase [Azospirillum rugosum]